jgi:hypothetical protein
VGPQHSFLGYHTTQDFFLSTIDSIFNDQESVFPRSETKWISAVILKNYGLPI